MINEDYDVIVTGAGPAGLSSALESAKNGAKTLILEKKPVIGEPTRTSGATWIDYLENYPFSEKALGNPIRGFYFCPPSLKEVYFKLNKIVGYVINVKAFYQELATMASKAGAEIRLNSKVERLKIDGNRISSVLLNNGEEIHGKTFIDASGMSAVLAKQVGLHEGKKRAVFCAEYDMWTPNLPQSDIAEFYFGNDIAPSGYAWIFPWSKERARVGVGIVQETLKENPLLYLRTFIVAHKIASKKLKDAQPLEFHYAKLPCTSPLKKTYFNQLLVVGDAAALISPLLGEGIRFCIEIGKIAGNVAAQAIQSEVTVRTLKRYQDEWKERFGKFFSRSLKANKAAAKFSNDDWDSLIPYTKRFNEYPEIGLRFIRSEFSISDLFKISPKFALKLGFKAI